MKEYSDEQGYFNSNVQWEKSVEEELKEYKRVVSNNTVNEYIRQFFKQSNANRNTIDAINFDTSKQNKTDLCTESLFSSFSQEFILDNDVHDLTKYFQEILENDDGVLKYEDLYKINNVFNDVTKKFLFEKLYETLSEEGLHKFNHSLCLNSDKHKLNKVAEAFCQFILLPKLNNANCSQLLYLVVKDFNHSFPSIMRLQLLVPLLKSEEAFNKLFENLMAVLNDNEKQAYLKDFLYSCDELQLWQIKIIQFLLTQLTEDSVKLKIINLMQESADQFSNEVLFLKLIMTLIPKLGKDLEDQEENIFQIIDKSTCVLKNSTHEVLKEWSNSSKRFSSS